MLVKTIGPKKIEDHTSPRDVLPVADNTGISATSIKKVAPVLLDRQEDIATKPPGAAMLEDARLPTPNVAPKRTWAEVLSLDPTVFLKEVPYSDREPLALALPKLDRLQTELAEQIPYQAYTKTKLEGEAKPCVEIDIGPLTERVFEALKRCYRGGQALGFDPTRVYRLADFLPTHLERLYEHKLAKIEVAGRPEKISTNCWCTAYELARGDSESFCLFYENDRIHALFRDDQYSSVVSNQRIRRNSTLQEVQKGLAGTDFGDTLIIYDRIETGDGVDERISHAVHCIDENLFFERTSAHADAPYRLLTLEMLLAQRQPRYPQHPSYPAELMLQLCPEGDTRFEVRRFDRQPLPDPEEAFGDLPREKPWFRLNLGAEPLGSRRQHS